MSGPARAGVKPQKIWPWGGGGGGNGNIIKEDDDAMHRGEATILLVREGSMVVTQGGVKRSISAGKKIVFSL